MTHLLKKYSKDFIKFKDTYDDAFLLGYLFGQNYADNLDRLYEAFLYLNKKRSQGVFSYEEKLNIVSKSLETQDGIISDKIMKLCQYLKNKKKQKSNYCAVCSQSIDSQEQTFQSTCCKVNFHGQCLANNVSAQLTNQNQAFCAYCKRSINLIDLFSIGKFATKEEFKVIESQMQVLSNLSGNTWEYNNSQSQISDFDKMFSKNKVDAFQTSKQYIQPGNIFKGYQLQPCPNMIQNSGNNNLIFKNQQTIIEVEEKQSPVKDQKSLQKYQSNQDSFSMLNFEDIEINSNFSNQKNKKKQNLVIPKRLSDTFEQQSATNQKQDSSQMNNNFVSNFIQDRKQSSTNNQQNNLVKKNFVYFQK
ncbi:hypothetical protein ABPG72_000673 [Tetrahymena utriculariae]